ncbi:GroES-like protein [Glarea lozoyensis ATCC 20868]|uniref:GroES-like protein n=2 Tax=Glarea lozoyensis TaxID=101852 RepID=S3DCX1_GLAL2|nr:GroES-like protein [Glarea lozoyensis ATCC 20868]EHL02191.1 putative Zinc-type alcohol dehydrogenase-like protein [Glarea lozoyensis 74030]EPE24543.1 GroES-like protein [Glarea lozoyensis ATCC 20868]
MSQKALVLREIGTPLVPGDRPIPQPGQNHLLLKVLVAGLNPHDQRTRDAGLFVTSFPFVPGSDIVGEVVGVGEGEHSEIFNIGDHVFGHTFVKDGDANDFNPLQQYALADARFVAKVADTGLSDDEASTIPVIVLAGFIALFSSSGLGLPPPFSAEAASFDFAATTLLVIGGGSNTGMATIELARLAGIKQIIVVAGIRNEAEIKTRGASHVIDRHAGDVLGQIRAITGDDLIYAVDTVNPGQKQEVGVAALSNSKKGTLITLRRPDGDFDPDHIGTKSAGYERRLVLGVSTGHPELAMGFWKEVPAWLKDGKISSSKYKVVKGLDADVVNKVLDDYRDGKGEKTNVHPWE